MDRIPVIPSFAAAQTLEDLKRILTRAWSEMANLVNNCFTLYVQSTMPTIPNNTTSLWQDTTNTPNEYYLVSNFGGTHELIQLTTALPIDPLHKHSKLWASDGDPQAVAVDTAGNVGIGTTAPATFLEVSGANKRTQLTNTSTAINTKAGLTYNTVEAGDTCKYLHIYAQKLAAGTSTGSWNFEVIKSTSDFATFLGFMKIVAASNDIIFNYSSASETYGNVCIANGKFLVGGSTAGASPVRITGLPTSTSGLSAGDVWCDTTGNILKIV